VDIPKEWSFAAPGIAAGFDGHVREQLPWYDLATGAVAQIARHFIPRGGVVVDVGASTGNIGRAIAPTLAERGASLIALEPELAMAAKYQAPGHLVCEDATAFDFAATAPDLVICFLVLMFLRPGDRAPVLSKIKAALRPGGALILFDKSPPQAGEAGSILYRLTLAAKYEAGADPAAIIAKELSLSGVQRPLPAALVADCIPVFRFGDFGGWLWIKPEAGEP
jgi:tRNA (cmo5U34)-methyltransferase